MRVLVRVRNASHKPSSTQLFFSSTTTTTTKIIWVMKIFHKKPSFVQGRSWRPAPFPCLWFFCWNLLVSLLSPSLLGLSAPAHWATWNQFNHIKFTILRVQAGDVYNMDPSHLLCPSSSCLHFFSDSCSFFMRFSSSSWPNRELARCRSCNVIRCPSSVSSVVMWKTMKARQCCSCDTGFSATVKRVKSLNWRSLLSSCSYNVK